MSVVWEKKGIIFEPNTNLFWSKTHSMIPTPLKLTDDLYRVYYSGRDDKNRSHIGFFEYNLSTHKIEKNSINPVLSPGSLGCFDDNGVTPSCILKINKKFLLYYIGWNPGSTVRMHLFGGLAVSDDGLNFSRFSRAPLLERTITDPYLNTAPWVVKNKDKFMMYYVSGHEWIHKDLPRYNIKIAYSNDGFNWKREGQVAIDFKNKEENALARPYVIFDEGIWKMWFSYKEEKYTIGYAESIDGIEWVRNDSLSNISPSKTGLDSEMIEYGAVIKLKDKYFMFYNGNNYGFNGIFLAEGNCG